MLFEAVVGRVVAGNTGFMDILSLDVLLRGGEQLWDLLLLIVGRLRYCFISSDLPFLNASMLERPVFGRKRVD